MLRTFRISIGWGELAKRTFRECLEDRVLGLASELAYYFLLALVPALVFVAAIASFFPGPVLDEILRGLSGFAPPAAVEIVQDLLGSVASGENSGVLTLSLLMALWSSSAAMVGITEAMNRAYDIDEGRPWWKVRLIAVGLTITLAVLVLSAFALVILGPRAADFVAARLGFSQAFAMAWKILQWPLVFAMVVFAIGLVNYFGPDAEQRWEWITPGSLLSTVVWLLASLAFKLYVSNFADYNKTYGSLGGVIVLMLWFYISALSILVGSEMNSEIEHASPLGKEPGEKAPGPAPVAVAR
jgi:membrane protein